MSTNSVQKTLGYQRTVIQDNLEYFKANHKEKQKTKYTYKASPPKNIADEKVIR